MSEDPHWRVRRRANIIAAASALFARASYNLVQMDDIARRAEVGKPTLYRYFPSKEELYLSVCEEAFLTLDARLVAASAVSSPPEALRRMVAALVESLGDQLSTLDFLHGEETPLAVQWRQLYRRRRRVIVDRLRDVFVAGIASGEFAPVDATAGPQMLIGMIRGGLIDSGNLSRERLVQTLCDFALFGLSPSPSRRAGASRARGDATALRSRM